MNLELLPNEIFLDLFDYFNGIHLLRAFYGLNSRFNVLLYKQFRSYRFRFDSISKRHFDLICQQHLPFIVGQVITLQLSNHCETPEQINLFFSYVPSLCQFTYLRSLALSHFHSYDIFLTLLDQCQHLSHFTRLHLCFCSFTNASVDDQLIINKIWSLPKLTNHSFYMGIEGKQTFCTPTMISTSLKCLTIASRKFQWNQLNRLLEHTPRLKSLSTCIYDSTNDHYIAYSHPALINLNMNSSSFDLSKMVVFFQSTPHLCRLDIRTWSQLINGHQWEQTIRNHLPKLKTLRLQMEKTFYHRENIQEEADSLLNSFRSSFWIDEHQWFVRCIIWNEKIHLQTVSGASEYIEDISPHSWQSTYPHDNPQEMYKNITSIYDRFFDKPISSNIRLPNIEYLYIKLPINEKFWSIVPSLDKLYSLTVSSHADTYQSQVQTLLGRAPHLHTLCISQDASLPLQMSLFKYTNTSVREIDLHDCIHDFNEEECLHLTSSSLGVQCEVLSIQVTNRQSIIYLVRNMLNIRSLNVKCADDQYRKQAGLTEHNDELVQWLKDQLPSTYMIIRDAQNDRNVLIWI